MIRSVTLSVSCAAMMVKVIVLGSGFIKSGEMLCDAILDLIFTILGEVDYN